MNRNLIIALSVCAPLIAVAETAKPPGDHPNQVTVVLDSKSPGRVFEGLGAVSAGASSALLIDYPEPYRSDILDFMFKPGFGAAFQHLKVEIGSGMNSTCGAEPSHAITPEEMKQPVARGYELWLAAEARKRNPDMILDALPWGTPYWTKNYFTPEAADWAVAFLDVAKKQYGLIFQFIGGCQNEYSNGGKGVASEETRTFIVKFLRPALDRHGYKDVGIVTSDFYNPRGPRWSVMHDLLKDPEYFKAVAAVGYHYPVGYKTKSADERPLPEGFTESGKRFWASEDYSIAGGAFASGWDYIGKILREYNELRITKSEAWPPFSAFPAGLPYNTAGFVDAPDFRNGSYTVYPALWCVAHVTQFVQPGWKFLDTAQGPFLTKPTEGMYAALTSPNGKDWSLIAVTEKPVSIEIKMDAPLSAAAVHVWKSDAATQFEKVQTVQSVNGVITVDLDPKSVYTLTTTTGQCKGKAAHPIPAMAPSGPWKDDFSGYKIHDKPKGWIDQEGTFEIADYGGANVLKQVVPKIGLRWNKLTFGECASYFGGIRSAQAFGIRAEGMIQNGYIEIGQANGAKLRLNRDGRWELSFSGKTTTTGKIPEFDAKAWHVMSMRIAGENQHICEIDAKQVHTGPSPIQPNQNQKAKRKTATLPCIGSSYDPNLFRLVEISY